MVKIGMDSDRNSLGLIDVLLWHLPGGIEEDHKKLEDNWCPCQDLNQSPPEYKYRFVTCRASSPVTVYQTMQRHISENSDLHSWLFLLKYPGDHKVRCKRDVCRI
jgi:hypothetical protein